MRELEKNLLQIRMLYTTTIDDYNIVCNEGLMLSLVQNHSLSFSLSVQLGLIHDSGEEGLVLRARCNKASLPNKEKTYAMKVLTNIFQSQTQTQVYSHYYHIYKITNVRPSVTERLPVISGNNSNSSLYSAILKAERLGPAPARAL